MSIRLMTKVWDSGQYDSGTLLVLLALCDWANDQGEKLFPYLETLAAKARLSVKQTRRALQVLIEEGVVIDMSGAGITSVRTLDLKLDLNSQAFRDNLSLPTPGDKTSTRSGQKRPARGSKRPDGGTNVLPHIDNHQSNHQENHQGEPSCAGALAVVDQEPPSETDLAVEAFNKGAEICPKWTACRTLTGARRDAIEARLKAVGLRGWLDAVQRAVDSAHLGGPLPTSGSHMGWRMDIGWFAKLGNFVKISEGGYAPAPQSRPLGLDSIAHGLTAFLQGEDDE